jgi:altronate hydrolase
MFRRMEDDMDINCGTVIDGDESVAACGARIFDHILRTASGERTKSEQWGFGAEEFAPWVQGATM